MSIPYQYVTDNPNHINTGSYFNKSESDMFISGFGTDLWYGFSEMDVIELSVFDLDENQIGWDTINTEKEYKKVTLTYLNALDQPVQYSYNELLSDFTLYKNTKILVNPIEQLSSSFGITQGSYVLSYNFVREMAGSPTDPLVVKDISPSRKEVKLIPSNKNNPRFEAFCKKKFQIKDVAPVLLQQTNQCPYDQIYSKIKEKYANEIAFLKQLLFLDTDSALISFIKTLYQDNIIYTAPPANEELEKVKRTQGIKGYYQNFILSNYETISDFAEIENLYNDFVTIRIDKQFSPYGIQKNSEFVNAKKFLYDFFTAEFYHDVTLGIKTSFEIKYYSYFKNALNIGGNTLLPIINHDYIDEREDETDPLTLVIKLKNELPETIKIQTPCWVTNVAIAPFVINAIFRSQISTKTIKISPPDFVLQNANTSVYNINQEYTAAQLRNTTADQQSIDINKKIGELQIDYTDFSNFVVFSSAQQRLSNFKTKISTWYVLSSSLVTLEASSSQSIVAGTVYPRYALEKGSLEGQMSDIVDSFDGYESYLFKTGSYVYNASSALFYSASYVVNQDYTASIYDKQNRDSLINNTPEHIVLDDGNDEYLMFLNMVGHFFDNIYLYITNLPSEKVVDNDSTKTFSKKIITHMLDSFGWKVGTAYEDSSTLQTYTTSLTSSMSEEDRVKTIQTRILNSLPQIYKTKGTNEAIKLLLSCHGIPSDLLDIREYGNNDYASSSLATYSKRERSCMFGVSGSGQYIIQLYSLRPNIRTIEFKLALDHPEKYELRQKCPFVDASCVYDWKWDTNWTYHTITPWMTGSYMDRGYYSKVSYPMWQIGFIREYGNMGRMYAVLPTLAESFYYSGSVLKAYTGSRITYKFDRIYLTSSILPIFDGDVFNIRLRRNTSDPEYQDLTEEENIPATYDLTVQRNESGRRIFRSIHSSLGFYDDNMIWDGISTNDVWETTGSLGTTTTASIYWGEATYDRKIYGRFGNAMIWDVPISDADFEVHCNDFSSFAYSGSSPETHLITRMDADESTNFFTTEYIYEYFYPPDTSYIYGYAEGAVPNRSEYYSTYNALYSTVVASGSWIGYKNGSLTGVENFTGSANIRVTASAMSGSGNGKFFHTSSFGGYISGSMRGLVNGLASGIIVGRPYAVTGIFAGYWKGIVAAAEYVTRSYFSGSFTGRASGSFYGSTTGQMTSSNFGTYYGTKTTPWNGCFTGSLSGSIRSQLMTGSFDGRASGSLIFFQNIGSIVGTLTQAWYGFLTGSLTGSFTGSTGASVWTGSSLFSPAYSWSNPYGLTTNSKMWYSGSIKGVISGSDYSLTSYATGSLSGAFIQPWTGSPVVLYNKSVMPTSITFYCDSDYYPLNPTVSVEIPVCDTLYYRVITSEYPYQYQVKNIEKIYTTPNWGPNRFRNEKITPRIQNVDVRLDNKERSTHDKAQDIETDSNLVGLYLDPQDAKNRDIVKYCGSNNIVDLIADPSNMYSASYSTLVNLNKQYNSFGDRRVLYNELITLYKLYFNRSIFESIENLIPARTNVRSGIVIEPTILERPKYRYYPISTDLNSGSANYFDVTASHYFRDPVTKILRFSGSVGNTSAGHLGVLYGEFNIDTAYSQSSFNTSSIPSNPTIYLDVSYVNEANFVYPVNYANGYVCDLTDNIQFGNYGSTGNFPGYPGTFGVTTQDDLDQYPHASGSSKYFIVKKWDKHTIYSRNGSHVRSSSKAEETYSSNSIWLYSLMGVTPEWYSQIFYTTDYYALSGSIWNLTENVVFFGGSPRYFHNANTAVGTSNKKINTLKSYDQHIGESLVLASGSYDIAQNTYFEVFAGYPRNHYTHKRMQYSPVKFLSLSGRYKNQTAQIYTKGTQTIDTTIDNESGLEDASLPVQSIETSNVNLVKSDNVINQ